ncbi:MAG: protein phosphatase 2C domain-containing protein [Streptosporangiaceae bacterium]
MADGMGGHAAGEVASSLTIASMAELDAGQPPGDMLGALAAAVAAANSRLHDKIIANPAVEGMGTTLTALLWCDGHAAVGHIGDSRGYLLRRGELYQITKDHTLVQLLVDEGRISAEDASTHPQRSLLLRALDGRSAADPDLSMHDALPGDRYLICSDGLSGVVSDETLRDTLDAVDGPDAATRELIKLANAGGGPDNITCIVADVVDTATTRLPPSSPLLAGAAESLRLGDGSNDPADRDVGLHHGQPVPCPAGRSHHTRGRRPVPQPVPRAGHLGGQGRQVPDRDDPGPQVEEAHGGHSQAGPAAAGPGSDVPAPAGVRYRARCPVPRPPPGTRDDEHGPPDQPSRPRAAPDEQHHRSPARG